MNHSKTNYTKNSKGTNVPFSISESVLNFKNSFPILYIYYFYNYIFFLIYTRLKINIINTTTDNQLLRQQKLT